MTKSKLRPARKTRSSQGRSFRRLGLLEFLEPRLTLSASSFDGRAYVDVGPSDNIALDQPRVAIELLTEDLRSVGPSSLNTWLLDTGANTTLAFESAVNDMTAFDPKYETSGQFEELGVGGVELFDVSLPYRFDFAGVSGVRNTLPEKQIISNPDRDIGFLGPYGIVGMPAMTERVTTYDFSGWTDEITVENLFMRTDFSDDLPEPTGPRYTLQVDNRVSFSPEGNERPLGGPLPAWADLPFFGAEMRNNDSRSEGSFLFDSGAQVSIINSRMAFELGLDSNRDGVLNALDVNYAGSEQISGISGTTSVPAFLVEEVHLPTVQGPDMVWTDLRWLILDIVDGIDGVFGFDNMTSGWFEAFAQVGQSGALMQSHVDFRGWETEGIAEIHFDFNDEAFSLVDPQGPGAIITESGGSTIVTESDLATDSYTIQLSQPPTADVTVSLQNSNGQIEAFDADNPLNDFLVFTPENWDEPRSVVVRGIDDAEQEGYQRVPLRHISSSADPDYDGVGMPRISVAVVDDEFAGMMILPTDGETRVTEGGGPDFYDVALITPPSQDVFIILDHPDNQLEVVADADNTTILQFTPTNWDVAQRVRVTAIDDDIEEGGQPAYINHIIATADPDYGEQAFSLQERAFVNDDDATIVYDSEGFEQFNLGGLVGQVNGSPPLQWEDFNAPNGSRFSVQNQFAQGSQAVAATGSNEVAAFVAPAINQTPEAGEIWVVEVDIARTISLIPVTPSSPGYNVDIYPSNEAVTVPNRIAGFGLGVNDANNAIEPFVSVFDGSPGGQVVPIEVDVDPREWVSFRAELNFDTETFQLKVNDIPVEADVDGDGQVEDEFGFVFPSSSYGNNVTLDFGDADLQHDSIINATDVGYFDNYRIFTASSGSDASGPRVTDVIASSSAWDADFVDIVDGDGTGAGNGLGLSLVGENQLDNLPWFGMDRIYVQFDEDVSADFVPANVSFGGVNVADYGAKLTYGLDGENVGTISLTTPLTNDIVVLAISDALSDAAGNQLDGEWTDAVSLISGDGTNGGPFSFRIDSLPGDVNDSDGTNLADVFDILNNSASTTAELVRFDVNSSGGINLADVFDTLNVSGTTLPDPPSGGNFAGGGLVGGSKGDKPGAGGAGLAVLLDGYGGLSQAANLSDDTLDRLNRFNPHASKVMQLARDMLFEQDLSQEELDGRLAFASLPGESNPSPLSELASNTSASNTRGLPPVQSFAEMSSASTDRALLEMQVSNELAATRGSGVTLKEVDAPDTRPIPAASDSARQVTSASPRADEDSLFEPEQEVKVKPTQLMVKLGTSR